MLEKVSKLSEYGNVCPKIICFKWSYTIALNDTLPLIFIYLFFTFRWQVDIENRRLMLKRPKRQNRKYCV